MFGRTILGVLAAIALVGLVAVIGTSVYNAGLSQGLAEAATAAAASGDPAPVVVAPYSHYGYGHGHGGWGFGFFGILFWILGFFLIFGLLRAAFGWGRWAAAVQAGVAGSRARIGWRSSIASFIGARIGHPLLPDDGRSAGGAHRRRPLARRVASAQHGHHPRCRRRAEDHAARS